VPKVEDQYVSPLGPQLLVPKVKNQTFKTIGLQLLKPKVGDPELGTLAPQLSVSKIKIQDFFAEEKFPEQKMVLKNYFKNINESSADSIKNIITSFK
jgi:hypothetical protein